MNKTFSKTRILVECALMVALATVLGFIPVYELPRGGSVTLVSMVPILLVSHRHGVKWGVLTAFVHSLIQLMLGIKNLAWCQTFGAVVGCIFLDYVLAFTLLGLACLVAKPKKPLALGVGVSTVIMCFGRYLCSFLSGYIVWKDYDYAVEWLTNFEWGANFINSMGQDALCWFYSFVYNLSYMLPETILTVIGALILYKAMPKLFARQA